MNITPDALRLEIAKWVAATTPDFTLLDMSEPRNQMLLAKWLHSVLQDGTTDDADADEVWPEWYSLLWGIPGFKVKCSKALAWKEESGISDALAVDKAYQIRDWWPRQLPSRVRNGNVYATWQNWCRRDKDKPIGGNGNGTQTPSGARREDAPRVPSEFEKYGRTY